MSKKPLLALLFVAACDPQATGAYEGESLLSMKGRVELALERDDSDQLEPTIAFLGMDNLMYVSDAVAVRGEFPASFEMDVLAPPPPETIVHIYDDEPGFAVGYITAASPDLPRVFEFESPDSDSALITVDSRGREWTCYTDGPECYRDELTCTDECIVERTTCPDYPSANANMNCTVSYLPEMKTEWENFAGLSENYAVLYLDQPAAVRSRIAHAVGARDTGLAAGYHLIHIRPRTADEEARNSMCLGEALDTAFARYNESHGTSYSEAAIPLPDDQAEDEIFDSLPDIEIELNCTNTDTVLTRVEHPENESITVRIGPNLEPLTD